MFLVNRIEKLLVSGVSVFVYIRDFRWYFIFYWRILLENIFRGFVWFFVFFLEGGMRITEEEN